ncbi:MAG: aminotransferase class V-fold PLP-dependent enzyme [Dehalococcoidia bacterium]
MTATRVSDRTGEDELLRWREEFPILASSVYLINNSLGAMPRGVYDSLHGYADRWGEDGVVAWNTWLPLVSQVGDLVGSLFGAPAGTVMMGQNVTNFVAQIASALDYGGQRNRIVLSDLEFPTVHYLWQAQERFGARIELVPGDDAVHLPLERLLAAIDERTLLVSLSQVIYRSSHLVDAAAVIKRAHEAGAMVLLDSYQAVGCVPIDVVALDADFLVGGSVKWLCGGPGAGFLYVRPDLAQRLEPSYAGWFSHKRPFAFEQPPIEYGEGISRFMGGTPGVPALYSAKVGYEIISQVGVDRIRAKSRRQTAQIVERAQELGLSVRSPLEPEQRGGHVTVAFEGDEAVSKELIRRRFIIDYRPGSGIRIAPHFYNTDEECDAILNEIQAIRRA